MAGHEIKRNCDGHGQVDLFSKTDMGPNWAETGYGRFAHGRTKVVLCGKSWPSTGARVRWLT